MASAMDSRAKRWRSNLGSPQMTMNVTMNVTTAATVPIVPIRMLFDPLIIRVAESLQRR